MLYGVSLPPAARGRSVRVGGVARWQSSASCGVKRREEEGSGGSRGSGRSKKERNEEKRGKKRSGGTEGEGEKRENKREEDRSPCLTREVVPAAHGAPCPTLLRRWHSPSRVRYFSAHTPCGRRVGLEQDGRRALYGRTLRSGCRHAPLAGTPQGTSSSRLPCSTTRWTVTIHRPERPGEPHRVHARNNHRQGRGPVRP